MTWDAAGEPQAGSAAGQELGLSESEELIELKQQGQEKSPLSRDPAWIRTRDNRTPQA